MSTKKRTKTTSYVSMPRVPPKTLSRFEEVMQVQSGRMTVTEAAAAVGLSRVRFQTLMHRALAAMIGELEQKTPGRPAKHTRVTELEEELRRAEAEKSSLEKKQEVADRVIQSLAEMVREKSGIRSGRSRSTKSKTTKAATHDDAEEDAARELEYGVKLVRHGLPQKLAARATGSSTSTFNRRLRRRRARRALVQKRGPGRKPSAA